MHLYCTVTEQQYSLPRDTILIKTRNDFKETSILTEKRSVDEKTQNNLASTSSIGGLRNVSAYTAESSVLCPPFAMHNLNSSCRLLEGLQYYVGFYFDQRGCSHA